MPISVNAITCAELEARAHFPDLASFCDQHHSAYSGRDPWADYVPTTAGSSSGTGWDKINSTFHEEAVNALPASFPGPGDDTPRASQSTGAAAPAAQPSSSPAFSLLTALSTARAAE